MSAPAECGRRYVAGRTMNAPGDPRLRVARYSRQQRRSRPLVSGSNNTPQIKVTTAPISGYHSPE